ncbi:cysteine-rich protein with zinc finger [Cryptosporidium ryanae]|uniref:cysteine-rich protein with zinc finger n=1 Tax=Cryptosporidium ryanae TaxID=515981 RepID=UPI00351A9A35|nr:cysteine-rich protein with zinc finger [Cryptosporidium ryanae]
MDHLFLAEFHGYIDEKAWEIAELSINYIKSINNCLMKLKKNDGVLESYSHLRDIIEIIRICLLHGILIDEKYFDNISTDKHDSSNNNNTLFHFVKLFPELKDIGNVDDMCFIAFLLMNKVLTGLLETINNPITKWNHRITKFYHYSSILRCKNFMNDFKSIINSFEKSIKIKNFHLPNNWLTYFAKLSLRWNNLGNDELDIIIENNCTKNEKIIEYVENKQVLLNNENKIESSLIYILNNKYHNENTDSSNSSLMNSGTIITHLNSNTEFEEINCDENENTQKFMYNDNDIRDIQELLDFIWNPIFEGSIIPRMNAKDDEITIFNKLNIKEKENYFDSQNNDEDYYCDNEITITKKREEGKVGKQIDVDNNSKLIIENPMKLMKYKERDTKEWYLYYYNIPTSREEEILILNMQENKCYNINCNLILNINKPKLNFCCFTGYFYCDNCFGKNPYSILPGLLAKYGNITPLPVSIDSKNKLEKLEDIPLISIDLLTADIWKSNKYLKQYVYLKTYLKSIFHIDDNKLELSKCQYKESIKRRLEREYNVNHQDKPSYFSIKQLIDIAYEILSQNALIYSNETTLQVTVKELTQITINWRKHRNKCIKCQFERINQ